MRLFARVACALAEGVLLQARILERRQLNAQIARHGGCLGNVLGFSDGALYITFNRNACLVRLRVLVDRRAGY